mmetsp:Transcript_24273/g.35675  ORF Transcript_24273/g.35675 Transcript_24273/m.35675 type:complete len:288 (+) Transcript_24273:94-957(+)
MKASLPSAIAVFTLLLSVSLVQFATSFQLLASQNPHREKLVQHFQPTHEQSRFVGRARTPSSTRLHLANDNTPENSEKSTLGSNMRRSLLYSTAAALATNVALAVVAPPGFKRIPTQFIAALGDPDAKSGTNAQEWGLWEKDPGPRGVFLQDFSTLETNGGKAKAGWTFDKNDWWLEEHGIIMEKPKFSLPAGRYLVTGGRLVTTVLTVEPPEVGDTQQRWKLDNGKLYDITHLPCRSARYKPNEGNGSPLTARTGDFPVKPGAEMPPVDGCDKQDYAVLFVIGVAT